MFRSYLAAALANLARNRLYAAISIVGLAVGMAAAILTGLYIRDELSFDRFIPGYRDVHVVISDLRPPGRPPMVQELTPGATARWLKEDFRQVEVAARLVGAKAAVRRGGAEALESLAWVDPAFFEILPLPALAGDPLATVRRPDGVVITRAMARKYFGRDAPLGERLEIDRAQTLTVGAVIADIPTNSHLTQTVFASGLNLASPQRRLEAEVLPRGTFSLGPTTYVRFTNPGAAAGVEAALPDFVVRHLGLEGGKLAAGDTDFALHLLPLSALHLHPFSGAMSRIVQGDPRRLADLGLIAGLILLMAAINFVNLMTARLGQRMLEVGVRKAAGAGRRHLVAQFIGEAVVHALLGLILAIAMVELLLPTARAVLERPLAFDYWRHPGLIAMAVLMGLGVGILAGAYPAVIRAGLAPVVALRGRLPSTAAGLAVREALVVAQFAILIGLILAVAVIALQTRFVLSDGLRIDKTRMLMLETAPPPGMARPAGAAPRNLCREAFAERVRALPGVLGAACSSPIAMNIGEGITAGTGPNGQILTFTLAPIDYGFLELYGLKPLAGRFFSRPGDAVAPGAPTPRIAVLNESAVRALGYASPAQAVGQSYSGDFGLYKSVPVEIAGVVPDFEFNSLHVGPRPVAYIVPSAGFSLMHVRLKGEGMEGALKALHGLWRQTGFARPPAYRFVDDYLRTVYAGVVRQGTLIYVLAAVAVLIAALGLFGLAAFTAERRTQEIGVRKAMGASTRDILQLLLWQFSKPVLWANLIAWPLGWWVMDRWLQGFSARIALGPGLFVAATAAALAVAWLTVFTHALGVARARPIDALRYE